MVKNRPSDAAIIIGSLLAISLSGFLVIPESVSMVSATSNTFVYETVNYGTISNSLYKNLEDGNYETITELDSITDTNTTASVETVVIGTAGGSAFPASLASDDASYRTYTETNTASGTTYQVLRPDSDGSVWALVEYPVSPASDYDKVDETTAGGDGDTTYLEGVTNLQETEMGMANPSDPGGSPDMDVTMWHISRGESTSSCTLVWGIEIGGVEYQGGSTSMVSTSYANFSYTWTVDPSDSLEWTLTDINGLETYVRVTDANPDTRTTQVALRITFNPSPAYYLESYFECSTTTNSNTSSFLLVARAYRSASENFYIQVRDWVTPAWTTRMTVSAGTETEYTYSLAANDIAGNGTVWLKLIGSSEPDSTQDVLTFDVLRIQRYDVFYWGQVDWRATGLPSGNLTLHMKGYVSESEDCDFYFWNYTTSAWDLKFTDASLSNHLHYFDIYLTSYVSSTEFKVRLDMSFGESTDLDQTTYYLDWLIVYSIPTDPPSLGTPRYLPVSFTSEYDPYDYQEPATSFLFWITYTHSGNVSAEYVRICKYITGTGSVEPVFDMVENDTGDTNVADGKQYHFIWETFEYIDSDRLRIYSKTPYSSEVQRLFYIYIHPPTRIDRTGITPQATTAGDYTFYCRYVSKWNLSPEYVYLELDGTDYSMAKNDTDDLNFEDGCDYFITKALANGTHNYSFQAADYYYVGLVPEFNVDGWIIIGGTGGGGTTGPSYDTMIWLGVVVVLGSGFSLLSLGYQFKYPIYLLLSGLIWILGGIIVLTEINPAWMVLAVGLGIFLFFEGGHALGQKNARAT